MKNNRLLLPLLIVLFNSGCASFGPTFVIDTPTPTEDFLVVCEWHDRTWLSGGHGGKQRVNYKVKVVSSDEKVDCGVSLSGGDSSVDITHPVYMGAGITSKTTADESDQLEMVDGVLHIKLTKTKLDVLDELKARFEAGEWEQKPVAGWDKGKTPASRYAASIGRCGFGYQYLDYYSEVKKVDKNYFKQKYNDFLLRCNQFVYNEILKNDPEFAEKTLDVDRVMELIWKPEVWNKYEK